MIRIVVGRILQTIGVMVAAGLGGLCSLTLMAFGSSFPILYFASCLLIGLLFFYGGSILVRSGNRASQGRNREDR